MPDFARAEVAAPGPDLAPYTAFLRRLQAGQVVALPLDAGEGPRRVMRALNAAAHGLGMRLARLPSDRRSVRFRVLAPERRAVAVSEAAQRARAAKARATRQARQERAQLQAMGIDPDAAGTTARPPRRRRAAARLIEAERAAGAGIPPDQRVDEPPGA